MSQDEIPRLVRAIRDLHGVEGTHVRSESIKETFEGETVWEGVVEVFSIRGHPEATTAYAWGFQNDDGHRAYTAVLGVDPIRTARDAVRAAVVAEPQRQKGTLP